MNDGKALYLYHRLSPADLQLKFSDIEFDVRNGSEKIRIAGWWIPASSVSDRCVLLIHGYADGKVGAIAWAPLWHSLGFNVCAIDLRAHGESGGNFCTAGLLEGSDVASIVRKLRETHPATTRDLYLFGISMGATVALHAAQECGEVAGIVMESPYADFVGTARRTAASRAMPSRSCFTLAVSIARRWAKLDYRSVRTQKLLQSVGSPVLWIYGDADRLVDAAARIEIQQSIEARGNPSDRVVSVANADHLMSMITAPEQVTAAIAEFTSESSSTSQPAAVRR